MEIQTTVSFLRNLQQSDDCMSTDKKIVGISHAHWHRTEKQTERCPGVTVAALYPVDILRCHLNRLLLLCNTSHYWQRGWEPTGKVKTEPTGLSLQRLHHIWKI